MRSFMQAALILISVSAPTVVTAQSSPTSGSPIGTIIEQPSDRASDALLTSIITWLSDNFDLQPTAQLPQVKHASAAAMTQRRYRGFLGADTHPISPSDSGPTTVAIYDRSNATIYLPMDWTGNTPADQSVLVHEMVHHLQHFAQATFECPQAREQLAYAAQQRWLNMFGHTLEQDFQIDPFTLLVTTRCIH
jgi:hypothetical protein